MCCMLHAVCCMLCAVCCVRVRVRVRRPKRARDNPLVLSWGYQGLTLERFSM